MKENENLNSQIHTKANTKFDGGKRILFIQNDPARHKIAEPRIFDSKTGFNSISDWKLQTEESPQIPEGISFAKYKDKNDIGDYVTFKIDEDEKILKEIISIFDNLNAIHNLASSQQDKETLEKISDALYKFYTGIYRINQVNSSHTLNNPSEAKYKLIEANAKNFEKIKEEFIEELKRTTDGIDILVKSIKKEADILLEEAHKNIEDINYTILKYDDIIRQFKEYEETIKIIQNFLELKKSTQSKLTEILPCSVPTQPKNKINSFDQFSVERIQKTIFEYKKRKFTCHSIKAFLAGIISQQITVLYGPPGCGKTTLAIDMASALGAKILPVEVQSTWMEQSDLLGYYNPNTKEFNATKVSDFILTAIDTWKLKKDDSPLFFILLEEMNLSTIEYYLSTILSKMEQNFITSAEDNKIELIPNNRHLNISGQISEDQLDYLNFYLPPNLRFIGTINIDSSTQFLSPKVTDRSFIIDLKSTENVQDPQSEKEYGSLIESYFSLAAFVIHEESRENKKWSDIGIIPSVEKKLKFSNNPRLNRTYSILSSYQENIFIGDELLDIIYSSKILPALSPVHTNLMTEEEQIIKNNLNEKKNFKLTTAVMQRILEDFSLNRISRYYTD